MYTGVGKPEKVCLGCQVYQNIIGVNGCQNLYHKCLFCHLVETDYNYMRPITKLRTRDTLNILYSIIQK